MKEIVIRGRQHEWAIPIPDRIAADLAEDGFEVFEVVNTVPAWAADVGLTRVWCFAQDVWNLPGRWL
jgi:hypothetical protein